MSRKHKLAAGAAALVTAAGTGGAIAATTGGSSDRQKLLGDAAARLHVSEPQLQSALSAAYRDRLNAEVASGKLTKAQAQRLQARLARGGTPFLRLGQHHHGLRTGVIRAAASYLGMTPKQLRSERQGGKSLAQIAQAQHKSVAGLKAAMTTAVKRRLDQAVASHRITAAQEQRVLAALPKRLDRIVNRAS
jgi:hypothetical protein